MRTTPSSCRMATSRWFVCGGRVGGSVEGWSLDGNVSGVWISIDVKHMPPCPVPLRPLTCHRGRLSPITPLPCLLPPLPPSQVTNVPSERPPVLHHPLMPLPLRSLTGTSWGVSCPSPAPWATTPWTPSPPLRSLMGTSWVASCQSPAPWATAPWRHTGSSASHTSPGESSRWARSGAAVSVCFLREGSAPSHPLQARRWSG